MEKLKIKPCKKIVTSSKGKPNGWLLEIASELDGFTNIKGQIYMTVLKPGEFKGYHLHADADYYVTCLKGQVSEDLCLDWCDHRFIPMGDGDLRFKTVFLPKGMPHGLRNIGSVDAYVLIYRDIPWSANIKDQLDIAEEDIDKKESWNQIETFLENFQR